MPTLVHEAAGSASTSVQPKFGARWLLKRLMIAILVLTIGVGGLAWLMHASIDPVADAANADYRAEAR